MPLGTRSTRTIGVFWRSGHGTVVRSGPWREWHGSICFCWRSREEGDTIQRLGRQSQLLWVSLRSRSISVLFRFHTMWLCLRDIRQCGGRHGAEVAGVRRVGGKGVWVGKGGGVGTRLVVLGTHLIPKTHLRVDVLRHSPGRSVNNAKIVSIICIIYHRYLVIWTG